MENIKIKLNYNNAFKWINEDNIYVIGYAYHKNKLLNEAEFLNLVKETKTEKDIIKLVKQLNGAFSIIKVLVDKIVLATNNVRSFPILYQKNGKEILISDNINNFSNLKINENNVQELLSLRVCSNNKTIYENIYQVPPSTVTVITENNIENTQYFYYKINELNKKIEKEIFEEMYNLYDEAVKRLIKYANGKKIVIPLSGGYDSRLIAYHLRKNNYNNVVCYTYGRKNNPEYNTAKKVAEFLNFELHFIEYKTKDMRKKYYNKKEYSKMADYFGRGISTPVIQEWIAIDKLISSKIIDKNCIVAPGFLGDFLAGGEVKEEFLLDKNSSTTNQIKDYILKKSYAYSKFNKNQEKLFEQEISKTLEIDLNNKKISKNKAVELLENFDLKEREAKYISNAVRVYDYYFLKWYLVYIDINLMNYFENIDSIIKCNRKLYKKYIQTYYNDLLNYAPIAVKKERSGKIYKNFFSKNFNRLKIVLFSYKDNIINFYGYFKISDYLKHCLQKNTNIVSMFAQDYIKYEKTKTDK